MTNDSLRFEKLKIWQLAQELSAKLSIIFYAKSFHNFSFSDQIMRASISISNNIAEGYERGSTKELIRFLYISKGSCGEVRSMIYLANKFGYISETDEDDYIHCCIDLSVKINNYISYLKNKL
jgi:four helix bundle protein